MLAMAYQRRQLLDKVMANKNNFCSTLVEQKEQVNHPPL